MVKKIIIIGNGAAGNAALEELLKQDGDFDITVITKENADVYYRPMLSEYISEPATPKRFYLHDAEWYRSHKIKVLSTTTVISIDLLAKQIILSDLSRLDYDKLLIATGSYNFIPPTLGSELEGVYSLRTLADANFIKSSAKQCKNAVIIGGGLLGLELGWQLKKLNINVTVLEMQDRLLPRQLDEEASLFFEKKVLDAGINVLKQTELKEIIGDKKVSGALLKSGETLPCDMLLFSIGIRADIALAQTANLSTVRGIVVDEYLRTSNRDIYAAGDCAEYQGINYAIWPEAMLQGKIAGLNMAGVETLYGGLVPFNIYQGMNLRLFSMGDIGSNPALEYIIADYHRENHFERYFFVNNKIVGGIIIGDIAHSTLLKKSISDQLDRESFEQKLKS